MKLDHRIRDPIGIGSFVRRMDKLALDRLRETQPAGEAAIWIDPTPTPRVLWKAPE